MTLRANFSMLVVLLMLAMGTPHAHAAWVVVQEETTSKDASDETGADAENFFTTRKSPVNLALPPDKDSFHFVVYGDRTGGVPAGLKVLEQAVKDTNLISPDLVMTVGDLIQGYNRTPQWLEQKDEFIEIMDRLDADWFPVAGNHDVYWQRRDQDKPEGHHESNYEKHFGPLWYSFKHKNTGFLVLYTDEGDREKNEKGFNQGRLQTMSDEQLEFLRSSLERLKDQKQVFVFLHHPRWLGGGYSGGNWDTVHKMLAAAGNVSAVFAGHIHRMTFHGKKDGIEYFTLATTGGHVREGFPDAGFLHHFNIVTVREDSYQIATVPVGTVVDPRQFTQEFLAEIEKVQNGQFAISERLPLQADGSVSGFYKLDFANPVEHSIEVSLTAKVAQGWEAIPDHQHHVIEPGKSKEIAFRFVRPVEAGDDAQDALSKFEAPTLEIETELLHEGARVRIPANSSTVEMTLANVPDDFFTGAHENRAFQFRQKGNERDGIRIESSACPLPQGSFTLEAWVNSSSNDGSQGVVAKTQSSEYAIFSHDGLPSFDVHLDGRYVTAKATEELPLNKWVHLAGVFDGEKVILYVDGKPVATTEGSGQRTINQLPIFIGADPGRRGEATRPFIGQVDEVRLSKGVTYDSAFEPEMRLKPDASTMFLFHLDRQIGPFVFDQGPLGTMARRVGNQEYSTRK